MLAIESESPKDRGLDAGKLIKEQGLIDNDWVDRRYRDKPYNIA